MNSAISEMTNGKSKKVHKHQESYLQYNIKREILRDDSWAGGTIEAGSREEEFKPAHFKKDTKRAGMKSS